MIDLHSHILPNIDDGSENMAMSLEMARLYVENGISKVIATPHHIEGSTFTSLEKREGLVSKLNKSLVQEGIDLEIFIGNEIYISMNMIQDIENKAASTLNHTRYVLVELPMYDIPMYTEDMIYELQLKGYIPIIAHPERNSKIIENPNIVYGYIQKGALAQLNLPSLAGAYGEEVKRAGEILLRHNLIHFLGTDAHSNRRRSPKLGGALEILKKIVSKEEFEALSYGNGKKLLRDEDIKIKTPIKYKEKKSFFNLFKRKRR